MNTQGKRHYARWVRICHILSLSGNYCGDIINFILYPRMSRLREVKEPAQSKERKELVDLESELRTTYVLSFQY